MTIEGLLISISGAVIALLLIIIGFFLRRLILTIDRLEATVSKLVSDNHIQEKVCSMTHEAVDLKIKNLENEIKSIKNK